MLMLKVCFYCCIVESLSGVGYVLECVNDCICIVVYVEVCLWNVLVVYMWIVVKVL